MLSSKMKQFFLSDMPVLGLFNYRKFLFSTPESADGESFSGSKVVSLYECWECKKLCSSYFWKEIFLEILQGCKIIQTVRRS